MTSPGPTVRRRQLGKKLRKLRQEAGRTPEDVATYLGVKRPTVTRIEQGKQAILPKNVRLMCQLYGVVAPMLDTLLRLAEEAGERGWWATYSDTVPNWFEDYVGLEADAEEIWSYESEFVPGLLQTPDYVRAINSAARPGRADLEQAVEFRQARQSRLTRPSPPRLHVIINEAALLRPVGGPEAMAAQLEHLAKMATQPNIILQVLPLSIGAHAGMTGPFSMLRFPDDLSMNVVYLEHERGATYLERPLDLERHSEIFRLLRETALSPDDSKEHLVSLALAIRANGGGAR